VCGTHCPPVIQYVGYITKRACFLSLLAILRQAPRYPFEHVGQDPVIVEGDREQVQSQDEVW